METNKSYAIHATLTVQNRETWSPQLSIGGTLAGQTSDPTEGEKYRHLGVIFMGSCQDDMVHIWCIYMGFNLLLVYLFGFEIVYICFIITLSMVDINEDSSQNGLLIGPWLTVILHGVDPPLQLGQASCFFFR